MGDRTSIEAPSSRTWKYQVFLSFRGEDTRKGFTGHLHAALSDAGISAFLDDNELERAEFIKPQLEQAIDGSMISIIVFSKRYADSSWCLDELVKIMECRERLGQQVIPLFYNVDTSDVRNQTGSFAQAFEKHEAGICEGKHEKEKVQRWRNALTQAADLCGEDLKNADNGHEAKFINKILGEVNKQLHSKYQLDNEHLVGITSRVKVLSNHLDIENSGSKDVVRMIGILGMGGIGKTTLAKTLYNNFERIFEGRSFLANVREVIAHQPITGQVGLQEQLLNDILKSKDRIKVDSVAKGIDMIRARLCCNRALVIIDDADDLQQLKAIARARDWFGPGSRIIITTRNQHLLEQVGVDSIYTAQEMDEKEALELFGWHAFESGYPNQEYLDLSKRVIRYCQGLPLALEVVGSFLIKRPIAEWESHLEKLERSPDGDIQKILRISFDGLPDHTKREIFLDISCFFIGMDRDYVTQILDGCAFSATIGISVLIERCLVTVSEENELMMHDLLRDMGREIVREKSPGRPEKFSRLWKHEDVTDVLSDESGTKNIEGVALDLDPDLDPDSDEESDQESDLDLTRFSAQAFTNMKKLRLLQLSGVELTGEYKDFPKKLIWLCWFRFPLESIPDDFPMQPKLVALDLQYSKLKIVWKDCKLHEKLKILNLSHSYQLKKSPDFSKFPNLEKLILKGCMNLSKVHSYIGELGRLSLVNLEGCYMLKDLPLNFYKSKSIETLILNGCFGFKKLADGLGDMVSLTILKADDTAIRHIPSSIVKLKKLKALSLCRLKGSPSTNLLPHSLQSLSSLRELALAYCSLTDDAFPKDLGSLISLENLNLARNDFCSLPSLSRLSKLHDLSLYQCINLRAIPDLPTNLEVLGAGGCFALEKMPDFSEMSKIRELYLTDSCKLTEVPGLDKSLNSMTRIHMEGCTNLTADFRNNILQRWTSSGFGGIYLNGIYDIPEWFEFVNDVDNIVFFEVPQRIMGRDLKGLTICFVYSSADPKFVDSGCPICIIIRNLTKQTALHTRMPFGSVKTWGKHEDHYLWQVQLSNDVLRLQGGDQVSILVRPLVDFVRVKKTGVHLEWDKVMKENMDNPDPHLYDLETNQDFSGGVDDTLDPHLYDLETNRDFLAVKPYLDFLGGTDDEARPSHDASVLGDQVSAIDEESAVEDDPLGHGDLCTRLSLSIMENVHFSGGADDGAGQSHGAFVRTNHSSGVDKQLEWDKVMKENMDNPDPHLHDLETNRDFLSLSIIENLDFSGGADDGAGRSHGASNQPSAVDKQLEWDEVMKENMDPHLYDLETNRDFSGGVDVAFVPNQTSVIHEQLAVEPYLDFFGGTDNEVGRSHDARPDDGAGRSHDAFVRTNQSSAVDEQLAMELMTPFQEIVVTETKGNHTEQAINVDGGRRSHDEAERNCNLDFCIS